MRTSSPLSGIFSMAAGTIGNLVGSPRVQKQAVNHEE